MRETGFFVFENVMQELISPSQSETVVLILALAVAIIGGALTWRLYKARAAAIVAACGVLMFGSWQLHKWLTRFDPQTGYFGLQSVAVLVGEALAFLMFGALVGWLWSRATVKDK